MKLFNQDEIREAVQADEEKKSLEIRQEQKRHAEMQIEVEEVTPKLAQLIASIIMQGVMESPAMDSWECNLYGIYVSSNKIQKIQEENFTESNRPYLAELVDKYFSPEMLRKLLLENYSINYVPAKKDEFIQPAWGEYNVSCEERILGTKFYYTKEQALAPKKD